MVANRWNRCGPQKLAKAIHRCLRRLQQLQEDSEKSIASARVRNQIRDNLGAPSSQTDANYAHVRTGKANRQNEAPNAEASLDTELQQPEVPQSRASSGPPPDHEVNRRPRLTSLDKNYSTSSVNASGSEVPADATDKSPILLVDDNEINLKLLVTFMQKAKYSYECATDGLQALEAYKRASVNPYRAFRYILMDISMPVMDGLSATREIRKFERRNKIEPRTIIIALTGLASEMTQNDALHSGIDHFRIKPVKFKDLLMLLED